MDVNVNVSRICVDELQHFKMTINICFILGRMAAKGGYFTGAFVFTGEVVLGLYWGLCKIAI